MRLVIVQAVFCMNADVWLRRCCMSLAKHAASQVPGGRSATSLAVVNTSECLCVTHLQGRG